MRILRYISFVLLTLLFFACAQVEELSGGAKDKTPPRLDSNSISPKNKSVNFNAETIEFKFDEFIVLDNPNENVIFSPSVKGKPTLKANNKKLTIDLSEIELESNTTYTISLNGAVKDYTEGNDSLYQYVFSTGTYLDSLELSGAIENSFTNKPMKEIAVLLYDAYDDSVIVNQKPKYFVKSNESGRFSFQNLKPGKYKLAAVGDKNKNLMYDLYSEEMIAFADDLIVLPSELDSALVLRAFSPVTISDKIDAKYEYPGRLIVKSANFNENTSIDFIEADMIHDVEHSNDTVKVFWNNSYGEKKVKFVVDKTDTLSRTLSPDNQFKFKAESNVFPVMNQFDTIHIHPNIPSEINNSDKIQFLVEDSVVDFKFINIEPDGSIEINSGLMEATSYKVVLPEGLYTSIHDSISPLDTLSFTTRKKEYYGNLLLKTSFTQNGFFELVNAENYVVFKGEKLPEFSISNLAPGRYQLRFVLDENSNFKWDTGSYFEKTQPEKVIYYDEEIIVRSNWDIELEWKYE